MPSATARFPAMNRPSPKAFTLPQLLAALALGALAASFALSSYRQYMRDAHLRQAQSLMMENSRFLHKYYAQHQKYAFDRNTWPQLPQTGNSHFCIRMQGQPHGRTAGTFTLKAVALDKTLEPRILKTNQAGHFTVCRSSSSSCEETAAYFKGGSSSDKDCTPYR